MRDKKTYPAKSCIERRELYPPEGHTFIWWWPMTNVVSTRCGAKRTKSNGE